jgi:FixJ family two-component response regulator
LSEIRGTVYIVDDDPSICEGVSNLLEAVGVQAETYPSVEDFREQWSGTRPGCLLLDARLPGMSGIEFQEQMQDAGVRIPVIFMTAHGDIPMVRKVMKAGAVEFLTKPFPKEELLHAIAQAFTLDRVRLHEEQVVASIRTRIDALTEREREVMSMVIAGCLNKQIAAEINLSEITVKLHRRHVMEKMHVDSLAELVRLCERVKEPAWRDPNANAENYS